MSPISDTLLTMLANGFGTLAVVGIVVYQFLEINAKRERERLAAELRAQ
ncbi:Epa4p [Rhodotorula toruloides]|nr:Epa4p [Rhodotorula toruloides]